MAIESNLVSNVRFSEQSHVPVDEESLSIQFYLRVKKKKKHHD